MTIVLDGVANTISGLSVGGLPAGTTTPTTLSQPLTLGTAQATTSGTSIDFTGIPSWVKRITVMFNGVSPSGTGIPWIQLGGSGGVETTGYVATSTGNGVDVSATGGFCMSWRVDAAQSLRGSVAITLLNSSTNTWVLSGVLSVTGGAGASNAGSKSLTATLDRIRLTTSNGTDTFDAGSVNIMYEG
jgi:hypothetical protein